MDRMLVSGTKDVGSTPAGPAREKAPLWESSEISSRILHQTDELIAFDKPYDWPTSGYTLDDDDCVQYHLMNYLREQNELTCTTKYPNGMLWAVHQLDADTSGVLLFARSKGACRRYHRQLSSPQTCKTYLAVIHGAPSWSTHDEQSSLGKLAENRRGVLPLAEGGQSAHTQFTVLAREERFTLVSAQIFTGRTHQIRLHLSHLGHPLVGEEWYCTPPCTQHERQALHAARISIHDPFTDTPLILESPLPTDLTRLIQERNLTLPHF